LLNVIVHSSGSVLVPYLVENRLSNELPLISIFSGYSWSISVCGAQHRPKTACTASNKHVNTPANNRPTRG